MNLNLNDFLKKTKIEKPQNYFPFCPGYKQYNWAEFTHGIFCQKCAFNINEQRHQTDKKKYIDKKTILLRGYIVVMKILEKYFILNLI